MYGCNKTCQRAKLVFEMRAFLCRRTVIYPKKPLCPIASTTRCRKVNFEHICLIMNLATFFYNTLSYLQLIFAIAVFMVK